MSSRGVLDGMSMLILRQTLVSLLLDGSLPEMRFKCCWRTSSSLCTRGPFGPRLRTARVVQGAYQVEQLPVIDAQNCTNE
jgi:hypothetical protein